MATESPPPRGWVGSIAILLVSQLAMHLAVQMIQPLIGIYLRELGASESEAVSLSGIMNGGSAIMMMIVQPIWGSLADKHGNRPMILRALGAIGFSYAALAMLVAPWQVLLVRLFQGTFAGANPAMIAMAAVVLPTPHLSRGLGLLQAAQSVSQSLAPLLGAFAIGAVGFRGTFWVAAGVMGLVTLLGFFRIHSPQRTARQRAARIGAIEAMRRVMRIDGLRTVVIAMLVFQGAFMSTNQMMGLQLYSISANETEAAARVGAAFTATALGTTLGATGVGWLSSRFTSRFLVGWSMALGAVVMLPMFLFQGPVEFFVLRFFLGLAVGGAMPSLRTALAEQARADEGLSASFGSLYGFSGSAQQLGMAIGSGVFAVLANVLGLGSIYLAGGLCLLAVAALWAGATTGPSWRRDPDAPAV